MMKKGIVYIMCLALWMTGCSAGHSGVAAETASDRKEAKTSKLFNVKTSYFDNFTSEVSDTGCYVRGTVHQADDENAIVTRVQAKDAVSVTVKGTVKGREGDIQLVYIAPDGAKTQVNGQDSEMIDATIKLSAGQGLFRFDGKNAVCDFEFQFGPADGVSYEWSVSDELETSEAMKPAQQSESESDTFHQVIRAVYGGDLPMAYSMDEIVGTTDEKEFLCEYKKLEMTLESNCVLLTQNEGDGTDRTIQYNINVTSGECAIMYDNDEGQSTVIWSGSGKGKGKETITLGSGASCLRLKALEDGTKLNIKIRCGKS